ncbi:MAG: small conductance mechanosensitive channel [Solirubrobacterales bacterium]|jgi:small-conductance mechanosensitive channel|nr:small conductance mechanosensitive channel [Solirubrobacterales bacterium]
MLRKLLHRTRTPFESRTQVWREAGLGSEIDPAAARRSKGGALVLLALIAGVLVCFTERRTLFPGYGLEVRIATVILLVILGWGLARMLARGFAPALYRRLDPGTAGTVGFLVRLLTILVMTVVALRIAGLQAGTLALGGGFTAVVFGLSAQQVLGNLLAGLVLATNRPFRVGERVRLQAGVLAGRTEGVVGQLGLFYTTLVSGADRILVPNGVLIQCAVTPLREPERVEFRARFGGDTSPREVQQMLEDAITVPLRYPPHIAVEELDRDDVVVRIVSTPMNPRDGGKLAEEVLAGVRGTDGNGGAEPA